MHTVEIPGGTAELLDVEDMTPRRSRALEVVQYRYPTLMQRLAQQDADYEAAKAKAKKDGTEAPAMPDAHLTESEAEGLALMQDATIYAQLGSWTLDIPRPQTLDQVQDMPLQVYNALKLAIMAGRSKPDEDPLSFEPNDVTVADDASPFPNSGNSGGPLPAEPAAQTD